VVAWSNQAAAAVPGALSVTGTAGSGATTELVSASANANGLRLWSAALSAAASADGLGAGVNMTDTLSDSAGDTYLAVQMSLPQNTAAESTANSVTLPMYGIVVPAGRALRVVNGGTGGTNALHQVTATVIYQQL
jgi:hypothetical protein